MLLFVNACMRGESRTERLARMWLERNADRLAGDVVELDLGAAGVRPLDATSIVGYCDGVATACYDDPMFVVAKQFAEADEVLIAAPLWNYATPAILHDYLEMVCSQGVTFDIDDTGAYGTLCKAKRLTYVTTAGGFEPDPLDDHAFGLVRTLAKRFWEIPEVELVAAWGLDIIGADVDALLEAALG